MPRTIIAGADLVLPDRVVSGHTLAITRDRIVDIVAGPRAVEAGDVRLDFGGALIVPGFIDVHVHGVGGVDVLDGPGAVGAVARQLPRWGVTAFCPTSVACPADTLASFLGDVREARLSKPSASARVLPAHLESGFINSEFRGAQPAAWVMAPASEAAVRIIAAIFDRRPDVGIVTLAPEVEGGMALLARLVAAGIRVSLGHSGATFDQAEAAIAAGAKQATHLFNRMRLLTHREPGLAGAVLASAEVAAELICDGHHVHPAMLRLAIAAKGAERVLAITDGTSGSGLARGACARLGGQNITVGEVARLDDGTFAGSVCTMDRAFGVLVSQVGVDLVSAARMCSTTPAQELGLTGYGVLAAGRAADFVVLDKALTVRETWIGGQCAWKAAS